jgi:hypothetical protein
MGDGWRSSERNGESAEPLPELGISTGVVNIDFYSAHPGECRDPDDIARRRPSKADFVLISEPYDLGPSIRRDKRRWFD